MLDELPDSRLKNFLRHVEAHHLPVLHPPGLVHLAQQDSGAVPGREGPLAHRPPHEPSVPMAFDVDEEARMLPTLLKMGQNGGWLGVAARGGQVVVRDLQHRQPGFLQLLEVVSRHSVA